MTEEEEKGSRVEAGFGQDWRGQPQVQVLLRLAEWKDWRARAFGARNRGHRRAP